MHTRTPRFLAAAAALALLAGACTDAPTAPAAAPGERPSLTAGGPDPRLIPNTVKYRDSGAKPATGRSGSAMVHAQAMLDRAGTTILYMHATHATDWGRTGIIRRAQIKASTPDGRHRFTRNLNGYDDEAPGGPDIEVPLSRFPGELQFQGLGPRDELQVQANVAGLDGERMDVVTVTETVKRLPDLRVEMTVPGEVQAGTVVNVLAVASEANGDMGAYTTCELYVGGQRVDEAEGVWIDAGDAVTCAMAWAFSTPGTYAVEVRVAPPYREWDTQNNSASATVQVTGQAPTFSSRATFRQTTSVDSSLHYQVWRANQSGLAGDYLSEETNASTHQYGNLYAWMPAHIPGSLDVRASMHTGERLVTSSAFTATSNGTDGVCVGEFDGRTMLDLCTWSYLGEGYTYVNYSFAAGTVTYHSRVYSRMWDQLTGTELNVYHWNNDYGWDDGLVPLGDDWRVEVSLGSPGGEHTAAATLRLEPQPATGWVEPYTCTTFDEPWYDQTMTVCRGSSSRQESIVGF